MVRKNSYKLALGICLLIAFSISLLILTNRKSFQLSGNKTTFDKASALIEFSDSIRNSNSDTAIFYYNKAQIFLEQSLADPKVSHLLARSYTGLAYIYSEKGESKSALKNDSIALGIASANGDKQIIAETIFIQGTISYRQGEYEKAMDCYQKALALALEAKDLVLQAKIVASRAMIYSRRGDNQKTIEGFNQALTIGKQLKNRPLIANNSMNLGVFYMNQSENDSALIYSNLALELFKKTNDKTGQIKCYLNMGNVYYGLSDFGKTIEFYQLSLQLALEMNDQPNAAKAYHNLSEIYIHLGDNSTATELLFKSIKIKEQLNEKLSLAKGYMGLFRLYFAQKDYLKALSYSKKALPICLQLNSISEIAGNYSSIATVYCSINKTDSAIVFYNKALELYQQIDYTYGISNIYINLGDVYRTKHNFPQAEKLLLEALQSKTDIQEEEGTAIVNNMLSSLYLTMANQPGESQAAILLEKAERTGLQSFKTSKRLGALPAMKDASSTLKEIYQKQGKYREAMEYAEISSALSDSILNKAKVEALTFAEARWNVEKKQQEIDYLENTQKLNQDIIQQKETESRQQKLITWFVAALLVLTLISAGIVTLYFQKRRDALYQKQLAKMTALRMQNARNTMSPHFFFNVLASLSGLSAQPEVLKVKLKSLSLLLRKVIENIDRTAVTIDEELSAVKAFVDLCSDKIPAPFNVEYIIEEGTQLKGLIPAMMIQIPVENAIKHGLMPMEGEKKLIISVTDFDRYQQITVTDNGIGLKASTGRSTGTGTGLKVLMQTIHLLNIKNQQKINFSVSELESNQEGTSGTTVNIQIPFDFNYTI